jgi:hypothetical protein
MRESERLRSKIGEKETGLARLCCIGWFVVALATEPRHDSIRSTRMRGATPRFSRRERPRRCPSKSPARAIHHLNLPGADAEDRQMMIPRIRAVATPASPPPSGDWWARDPRISLVSSASPHSDFVTWVVDLKRRAVERRFLQALHFHRTLWCGGSHRATVRGLCHEPWITGWFRCVFVVLFLCKADSRSAGDCRH